MKVEEIIDIAKKNNCIVIAEEFKSGNHYHVICDYLTINGVVITGENKVEIKQINSTIYFNCMWIDENDIKELDFTGSRMGYKIL